MVRMYSIVMRPVVPQMRVRLVVRMPRQQLLRRVVLRVFCPAAAAPAVLHAMVLSKGVEATRLDFKALIRLAGVGDHTPPWIKDFKSDTEKYFFGFCGVFGIL